MQKCPLQSAAGQTEMLPCSNLCAHSLPLSRAIVLRETTLRDVSRFPSGGGLQKACPASQAIAAWQWSNFLHARVPLHLGQRRGIIFPKPPKRPYADAVFLREAVSRKKLRGAFTHVCIVCDDPEIQTRLPQFILGGSGVLQVRDVRTIGPSLPANVRLVRRKSGWLDLGIMLEIVRSLKEALQPYVETHQPILALDAFRVHLQARVAAACAEAGIFMFVIPAGMTFALQPADTHVFVRYKAFLRERYQRLRLQTGDGAVHTCAFLALVIETIARVVEGISWKYAFDATGFGPQQQHVSSRLLRMLAFQELPAVSDDLPTEAQLLDIYPRRSVVPIREVFRLFSSAPQPPPRPARRLVLAPSPAAWPAGPLQPQHRRQQHHCRLVMQ
jgi:hypothetical protein